MKYSHNYLQYCLKCHPQTNAREGQDLVVFPQEDPIESYLFSIFHEEDA